MSLGRSQSHRGEDEKGRRVRPLLVLPLLWRLWTTLDAFLVEES